MLVVSLLILTSGKLCHSQKLLPQEDNSYLATCIQNIILIWNKKGTDITFTDLNYQDNDILKAVHKMNSVTIVSKTANEEVLFQHFQHNAYIFLIDSFITFNNEFSFITNEEDWRPNANMVIAFREYEPDTVTNIFEILLRLHIFDVVVIYASKNTPIHTYNPFHNKNCGKTFNEIIKYDNCSEENVEKTLIQKPVKDFKGCTFIMASSHWPPFTINSVVDNNNGNLEGTEQYLMKILSRTAGFSLKTTYIDDAEEFPVIGKNMTATGSLGLLQKGHIDIVIGGMILTHKRARTFNYFHGHHDFEDELSVLVKKAGRVPTWKNIYLEFTCLVWILLVVTFIAYFVIIIILFRVKDKSYVILIMWDLLFQHGHKLRLTFQGNLFLFQWVLFAFLINTYYQSNLSGLMTHVSHNYQISNTKDLDYYKIQPCLSPLINVYAKAITGREATNETNKDCNNLLNSIRVVSKDYTKYTVVLASRYNLNNYKFRDEFGEFLLYKFPTPKSKIIYAVYFYKGFPMVRDLYYQVQRIRETGLLDKRARDIYYEITRKYNVLKQNSKAPFILPWQVLVIGYGLSTVTFLIEIIMGYIKKNRRPDIIFLH